MLDSALNAPFQTFGEEDVYVSLQKDRATRPLAGGGYLLCQIEEFLNDLLVCMTV